MSESRLMYVAEAPANNRLTAARMMAAARRQRERAEAAERQRREWERKGYCRVYGPDCEDC